jgi:hypothetical protein
MLHVCKSVPISALDRIDECIEMLPANSTSTTRSRRKRLILYSTSLYSVKQHVSEGPSLPQHPLHFAIIAAFAVIVSACSSTYIVRCKDGDHLAIHDSLYFGTAKPGGVVSSEDWAKFLETTVTPRFPKGLTSSRASGQWLSVDGEIVREDSHVLQLLHPDDATTEKAIRELVEAYKTQFRQEAVMRIRSHTCASF